MKTLLTFTATVVIFSLLFVSSAHAKGKADAETEQVILKFEQDWANAYVKGDAAALDQIEADDFVFVGSDGMIETKADEVRNLKSKALKMTECKVEDMKVRVYGKTAIVTGVNTIKGSQKGQDISGKYRFTDVLVRKKDKWQAVSTHVSMISEKK
jgi:ketosteroid isomerase-like protein